MLPGNDDHTAEVCRPSKDRRRISRTGYMFQSPINMIMVKIHTSVYIAFFLFFLSVLEFELRALHLLGRPSTI
jgi:hypothetical protein